MMILWDIVIIATGPVPDTNTRTLHQGVSLCSLYIGIGSSKFCGSKFCEIVKNQMNVNFRDKNFVIAVFFHD